MGYRGDLGDRESAKKRTAEKKAKRAEKKKSKERKNGAWAEAVKIKRERPAMKTLPKVVLVAQKIIPPVQFPPRSQTLYAIVPDEVEFPTITLPLPELSDTRPAPWSIGPLGMSIPFLNDVVGTLMVMVGSKMVAALATKMTGSSVSGLEYTVGGNNIRMRLHTGRGHGRGGYVRPRGEGGELPDDDADPYDQPSEWWEFWKWSF